MVSVAVLSVGLPSAHLFLITYVTMFAARKPSSSSNTTIPLSKNVEEGTSSKAMANDPPIANGTQKHENKNVDKPGVIAKAPMASKPMGYESLPMKKPNGSSNGSSNHKNQTVTPRKTIHFLRVRTDIADLSILVQAPKLIQAHPMAGTSPESHFPKTNRSQCCKRRSSQPGERLLQSSMMSMMPTSTA